MTTEAPDKLLERVRKLLAKAEDESCTPPEAKALTAKAAELMAKYGIDRALLAATRPETDAASSRMVDIDNPWGRVKAHLLCGLGAALRCQCIMLTPPDGGLKIHLFGYESDLERTDVLYTSVLIQMWHGLAAARVPERSRSPRAWRRSWLLGFAAAVISRVREAEERATGQAGRRTGRPGVARAAGPGRPVSGDPGRGAAGVPGDPHGADDLLRLRLRGRLRPGPARRHRDAPRRAARRPHADPRGRLARRTRPGRAGARCRVGPAALARPGAACPAPFWISFSGR